MVPEELHVASGGVTSRALVFEPTALPPRAVVLCVPAMGVPASFYVPLGEELQKAGLGAVVAELRGIGSSSVRAGRATDFGYDELVGEDLPAALAATRARFPGSPPLILGHSLGGHVALLAAARDPEIARGLVLVASGSPYFRNWPFPASGGMRALAHVARGVSTSVGHFPGRRLGFAGREARTLMNEWAAFVLRGRLDVRGADRLADLRLPVLALSLEGDRFAPGPAVDHLVGLVPRAHLTREHVEARGIDHFRWVKRAGPVVARLMAWVDQLGVAPR